MEKENDNWLEMRKNNTELVPVFSIEKPTEMQMNADLEKLVYWYLVPIKRWETIANNVKHLAINLCSRHYSNPLWEVNYAKRVESEWTQENLDATWRVWLLGKERLLKKRMFMTSVDNMDKEEHAALKSELDELDKQ